MLRITQLKLPVDDTKGKIKHAICKELKITEDKIIDYSIFKQSIDARKKQEVKYIMTVDVTLKDEEKVLARCKSANVAKSKVNEYSYEITGRSALRNRPIVVGSGPAGLFCAYFLAKSGYRPILLERGESVEERVKSVDAYWRGATLDPNSNVQFGEGGAGTFSDGKLNTMVKDPSGRIREVLETFVHFGAPEDIIYINKPHIGTDLLRDVVKNMRNEIIALGGEVMFQTTLTNISYKNEAITHIEAEKRRKKDGESILEKITLPCDVLVLAIGHSARDTFSWLYEQGIAMEKKPFAVGVRMEHKQQLISQNQYGDSYVKLPPADYKVTHKCSNGKGVYSFCMCPGGFVVNASSEEGRLVVNGMSNRDRAEQNANSAIVVTVDEEDFLKIPGAIDTPLIGMEFQRFYEALAYACGNGKIPVQLFGDLLNNKKSAKIGHIIPNLKGEYTLANLRDCLPKEIIDSIIEGILAFDRMIPGFADEEAIISGVEMRTSSPVRITRNEDGECNIAGIYPCGEGAGYAGGITSAAVDGIKVFEQIIHKYQP